MASTGTRRRTASARGGRCAPAHRDRAPAVGTHVRSARSQLWGFPFFYWYQLVWVFIAAILVGSAFVLVRRDEQAHRAELTHGRVLGPDDPLDEELGTDSATGAAMTGVNGVALAVLIVLFVVVTVLGFMAARWRRRREHGLPRRVGLGGRTFGTWITWFLLGGDLYTAYTFVAVPAAMFATGAVAGFFAVPYTIILYPIIFIFMARLWSVATATAT